MQSDNCSLCVYVLITYYWIKVVPEVSCWISWLLNLFGFRFIQSVNCRMSFARSFRVCIKFESPSLLSPRSDDPFLVKNCKVSTIFKKRRRFNSIWQTVDSFCISLTSPHRDTILQGSLLINGVATGWGGGGGRGAGDRGSLPSHFNFRTKQGPTVSVLIITDVAFYGCSEIMRTRNFTIFSAHAKMFWQFTTSFHFSNCLREIHHFTLELLKRSNT